MKVHFHKEVCENKAFQDVFKIEDTSDIPDMSYKYEGETVCDVEFSVDDVKVLIMGLRESSSLGPDGIHTKVLRECCDNVAYPIWLRNLKNLVLFRLLGWRLILLPFLKVVLILIL